MKTGGTDLTVMDASLYGINPDVIGYLNHTDGNLNVAHTIGRMIYSEL